MSADLRIVDAGPESTAAIGPLAELYRYNDFRRYPSVRGKAAVRYLSGLISEHIARPDARSWRVYSGEKPGGLAILSPLSWDSEFFGLKMARLSLWVVANESRESYSIADQLIAVAVEGAREARLEHLSLRVDVEDIGVVHALEKQGFRLMDTLFTYAFHPGKNTLPEINQAYHVRSYVAADYGPVMDIAEIAFEDYPSRFSVDPHIPKERSRAYYREWTRKCCTGELAEEVLVAERKGRVIGFIGWRVNQELERHTGVRIMGGGLGACYPLRFNAYLELLRESTRRALARADACDCETQTFNMATANFYQRLDFRYVRAKYSFHRWLGS